MIFFNFAIASFANVANGGLNYLFQLLLVALLTPEAFGLVTFLVSLCLVIVAPNTASNFEIARIVSQQKDTIETSKINNLFSNYIYLCLFTVTVFMSLSWLLRLFELSSPTLIFDIPSTVFVFALCLTLATQTQLFAILWGQNRILSLSSYGIVIAILKMFFIWLFHDNIYQVMVALFVAQAIPLLLIILFNKYAKITMIRSLVFDEFTKFIKERTRYFVVVILSAAILQSDILIVKFTFPAGVAGQVITAIVLAKAILFFISSIGMVSFPILSRTQLTQTGFSILLIGTALTGAVIAICFFSFADVVLTLLYGSISQITIDTLKIYGFALIPIGIFSVIEHVGFAKEETHILLFQLVLILAQILGCAFLVTDPIDVSYVFLLVNSITASALVSYVWYRKFKA